MFNHSKSDRFNSNRKQTNRLHQFFSSTNLLWPINIEGEKRMCSINFNKTLKALINFFVHNNYNKYFCKVKETHFYDCGFYILQFFITCFSPKKTVVFRSYTVVYLGFTSSETIHNLWSFGRGFLWEILLKTSEPCGF